MKYSAASKRAAEYPHDNAEWYCNFSYRDVTGIGYEEGICRRDPSSIIKFKDEYYVWYTKSEGDFCYNTRDIYMKKFPWDYSDIWYATSKDGLNWEEKGIAIPRGEAGAFDSRTVCTPEILEYDGKFYLVYQTIKMEGAYVGTDEKVAMAIAENPNGPWVKLEKPILEKKEDGHWFDDTTTYNDNEFEGTVHDPILFAYNGKFHLYYKCCISLNRQHENKFAGTDSRWGVAIADKIEGPYIPSEYNPITNSGHETLLWEYNGGIAALLNREGPERETIQYAKDGINFEIMSHLINSPTAAGGYKTDCPDRTPLEGIRWGLYHPPGECSPRWNYLKRYDLISYK